MISKETYRFQLFFCLFVTLLQANPRPVDLGRLEALYGHSGFIEADKNGVVGPAGAIQTNKILVKGHLAVNRKEETYYNGLPTSCISTTVKLKNTVSDVVVYTGDHNIKTSIEKCLFVCNLAKLRF